MIAEWENMARVNYIQINKPEPIIAAFEYVYRVDLYPEDYKKVTLKFLAEKYQTTTGSISNRKKQIEEYFDDKMEMGSPIITRQSPAADFSSPAEDMFRAMNEQVFEDEEDIERFIQKWNETGGERMIPDKSEAEKLFEEAVHAQSQEQKETLEKVLNLEPDYIDALILYSFHLSSDERERCLTDAVKIGEEKFDDEFEKENAGSYWMMVETRPYMRALYAYAKYLIEVNKKEKAREYFERIMYLNENDNLGVRYDLIPLLIELGKFDRAEKLFDAFPEQTTEMMYHKVLYDYKAEKPEKELNQSIKQAIQENEQVIVVMGILADVQRGGKITLRLAKLNTKPINMRVSMHSIGTNHFWKKSERFNFNPQTHQESGGFYFFYLIHGYNVNELSKDKKRLVVIIDNAHHLMKFGSISSCLQLFISPV